MFSTGENEAHFDEDPVSEVNVDGFYLSPGIQLIYDEQ